MGLPSIPPITEADWLVTTNLIPMLPRIPSSPNSRKQRLFGCACIRNVFDCLTDARSRRVLELLEQYIEGATSWEEVEAARRVALEAGLEDVTTFLDSSDPLTIAVLSLTARAGDPPNEQVGEPVIAEQCHLLRDIFGNPFRPATLNRSWSTSTVVALARGIYEERAFDRLPILADALQDAGCDNEDVLSHCRGPGPHVRGCWVVDLVLGKT